MSTKPYDQAFKYLAEQDAEALLLLLGDLQPGQSAQIELLPREISVAAQLPDQPYQVVTEGERRLVHVEAQTTYPHDLTERMVEYDVQFWIKYRDDGRCPSIGAPAAQDVLTGRMKRYGLAVIKRAFTWIFQSVQRSRIRLTADGGFPDDDLVALLTELKINFIIRVQGSMKVFWHQPWRKLNTIGLVGNARRRNLGRLYDGEITPAPTLGHEEPRSEPEGNTGDLVSGQQSELAR